MKAPLWRTLFPWRSALSFYLIPLVATKRKFFEKFSALLSSDWPTLWWPTAETTARNSKLFALSSMLLKLSISQPARTHFRFYPTVSPLLEIKEKNPFALYCLGCSWRCSEHRASWRFHSYRLCWCCASSGSRCIATSSSQPGHLFDDHWRYRLVWFSIITY